MTGTVSGRPTRGEFADYAIEDIAAVGGDDAIAALRAQSQTIIEFMSRLAEDTVQGLTCAPGKWTLKEVFGHMIDDERILMYRALSIARNERRELPGFDENEYVAATHFESRTLASLVAEYRAVRDATVAFLETLSDHEWRRRGTTNGYTASVRGLAFHLAGHELHHFRVLRERYLPQRNANGH